MFVGATCGCFIWKYNYFHMTSLLVLSVRRCIRGHELSLFYSFLLCPLISIDQAHCLFFSAICITRFPGPAIVRSYILHKRAYLLRSATRKPLMVLSDFLDSLSPVLSYLDYLFQCHLLGDQRLSAMSQARTQRRETIILSVQRQGFPRLQPTCCSQFRSHQDPG